MTDPHRLDDDLVEAFADPQLAVSPPPPIGDLLARREATIRRRTVGAGAGVVLLAGLGGLWVASDRGAAPVPAPLAAADAAGSAIDVFECTGPLGSDGMTWWFESCAPADVDPANLPGSVPPTTTIAPATTVVVPDDVSVVPATIVPVTVDPAVPASTTTSLLEAPGGPDRSAEVLYEIQFGDFPLGVAAMFCVRLEDLLVYNEIPYDVGIDEDGAEFVAGVPDFPGPGVVIRVPPGHSTGC